MKSNLNITLVAAGAALNGDLILDHGVSCFGLVDGSIVSTKGLLHVGEGGLIKGTAQGEHVQIDGKVEGDVHARESLEINGQVSGNIFYCGTIRLGPSASLNGALKRISKELTIENESNVKEITRAVANQ
ncbi:polymer-forming cytoskeletal protein [Caballeronia sp. dw_19]|uniref:bactofilin family protein n=1 Tax=Caballeronia sp. dw_19 TaxID=2719791 RepID=UPI001BD6C57A|nr:polymer-forming cytoskeletal protein [Caballeronia sp. dw_19]